MGGNVEGMFPTIYWLPHDILMEFPLFPEDFYLMCPDEEGDFCLHGFISCFPSGFLGPAKLGQSVREIHQPVPGYEERLGKSVDRYFKRMVPGQFVGRMNVGDSALCSIQPI
jgi:hypothetical protein